MARNITQKTRKALRLCTYCGKPLEQDETTQKCRTCINMSLQKRRRNLLVDIKNQEDVLNVVLR